MDSKREILYKKGRKFGTGYHIVEISKNENSVWIMVSDASSPQVLVSELKGPKGKKLLTFFENNLELLAQKLYISNEKLCIKDYKHN